MYTSGKRLGDGEVVRRTLRLDQAIASFSGEWFGLMMLVRQTGLPKGTVHRYLAVFIEEGRVERGHTLLLARAYREVPQEERNSHGTRR